MALDRQSIEKKDFPIGRRGYDPEAVDAHLSRLAAEVDELKRSSRKRTETLASAASEQVRAIVEAAETSAGEIQRHAEQEAREIRAEASSEAQSTREQASEQAREYVGKVSESTTAMLQRLDAMESELGALIESLRTGSNRLSADLQLLDTNLSEVNMSVWPRPPFEHEGEVELGVAEEVEVISTPEEELAGEATGVLEADGEPLPAPEGDSAGISSLAPESADSPEDAEGARLIALNMALNGTPREETDRYLAENFQLSDRDSLLDEVYASVEE